MNEQIVRIAVVSDIHLGNPRNKTKDIVANLNKYLSNSKFLSTIDILFVAGDVFDEALYLSSEGVEDIDLWIAKLLRRCEEFDVVVRVLEGTPSHDRGQSQRFLTMHEVHKKAGRKPVDIAYIKELCIEHIDKFDMDVLYVPDEWGSGPEDALDQVKAHLRKKELEQVDVAIMHGMFGFQLPEIARLPKHNEEEYLRIVREFIFIGHVHTFAQYKRIIAQGSFDRLSHNEEEPKGFVRAIIHPALNSELTFIENKTAHIYKTITCYHEQVTDNLLLIDEKVKGLKPDSHVRIEAHYTNSILSNMMVIKERWPQFKWDSIAREKQKKQNKTIMDHKNTYVPISLDRQNLTKIVLERLSPMNLDQDIFNRCTTQLTDVTGVP